MEEQVASRRLKPQIFPARRGDVFIWSAYLLHGGSPIISPERTRNSIVFHYFSEEDSRAVGLRLVPDAGAYWAHRAHQQVPGEPPSEAPPLSRSKALQSSLRLRMHKLRNARSR